MHKVAFLFLLLYSLTLSGQQYSARSPVIQYQSSKKNHPRILITSPDKVGTSYRNGIYITTKEEISIKGSVESKETLSQIAIDGQEIRIGQDNSFMFSKNLDLGEFYQPRITATDSKGRTVSHEIFIRRLSPEKKMALVIGNSNYRNIQPLKNPINDAILVGLTLSEFNFDVSQYEDLTHQQTTDVISNFAIKADAADVVWIYYAGHGFQKNGINYLAPIDANLNLESGPQNEKISVDRIINIIEENNPDCVFIMVLDACRNDPTEGIVRGAASPDGFAEMDYPPAGTLVAYSTAPGKYASDGPGENGLYTSELINQMKISQPIENVFKNASVTVNKNSDGAQIPWIQSNLRGTFRLH